MAPVLPDIIAWGRVYDQYCIPPPGGRSRCFGFTFDFIAYIDILIVLYVDAVMLFFDELHAAFIMQPIEDRQHQNHPTIICFQLS